MTQENKDKFALLIDRIDNITAALDIPMASEFHLAQIKEILPEISAELKEIHFSETDEIVWD